MTCRTLDIERTFERRRRWTFEPLVGFAGASVWEKSQEYARVGRKPVAKQATRETTAAVSVL